MFTKRHNVYTLLACVYLITACGGSPVIKAGVYHQENWDEVSHTLGKLEVGYAWDHVECGYVHVSEFDRGSPFNSKRELLGLDMAGCSVGVW